MKLSKNGWRLLIVTGIVLSVMLVIGTGKPESYQSADAKQNGKPSQPAKNGSHKQNSPTIEALAAAFFDEAQIRSPHSRIRGKGLSSALTAPEPVWWAEPASWSFLRKESGFSPGAKADLTYFNGEWQSGSAAVPFRLGQKMAACEVAAVCQTIDNLINGFCLTDECVGYRPDDAKRYTYPDLPPLRAVLLQLRDSIQSVMSVKAADVFRIYGD